MQAHLTFNDLVSFNLETSHVTCCFTHVVAFNCLFSCPMKPWGKVMRNKILFFVVEEKLLQLIFINTDPWKSHKKHQDWFNVSGLWITTGLAWLLPSAHLNQGALLGGENGVCAGQSFFLLRYLLFCFIVSSRQYFAKKIFSSRLGIGFSYC